MLFNKEIENSRLIGAGFRPERFSFFVKWIRKILWPFIRPFHFHQNSLIERLHEELYSLQCVQAEQSQIISQHSQIISQYSQIIKNLEDSLDNVLKENEETKTFINRNKILTTDLQAVANRLFFIEKALDKSENI